MSPLWKKKREEIPEAFRDLSDEQLLEKLQKASSDEDKAKELEEKFTAEQTAHGQTKAALQALEANRVSVQQQQQQTQRQQQAGNGQQQQNGENQPQATPSVFDDEDAAFSRRLEPLAAATIQAGRMSAKQEALRAAQAQGDIRVWNKYEKEINEIMDKELPARGMYPQVWLNALTFVKGIHMKEILEAASKGNDLFSEGVSDTGHVKDTPPPEEKLSDEEARIAKKMGVSPENWLKTRKQIKVQA